MTIGCMSYGFQLCQPPPKKQQLTEHQTNTKPNKLDMSQFTTCFRSSPKMILQFSESKHKYFGMGGFLDTTSHVVLISPNLFLQHTYLSQESAKSKASKACTNHSCGAFGAQCAISSWEVWQNMQKRNPKKSSSWRITLTLRMHTYVYENIERKKERKKERAIQERKINPIMSI